MAWHVRFWVSLITWVIVSAAVGCSGDRGEPSPATRNPTGAAAQSLPGQQRYDLNLTFPLGTDLQNIALHATRELHVEHDTVIQRAAGGWPSTVNVGSEPTRIDNEAVLGDIFSQSRVVLDDRVRVNGSVKSAGSISTDSGVVITGQRLANTPLGTLQSFPFTVQFPPTTANITVQFGGTVNLNPGAYSSVEVRSNGTLRLRPGTYHIVKLDLDLGARLQIDANQGPVRLYIRDDFDLDGRFDLQGSERNFLLGYFGSDLLWVNTPFKGTILAPFAKLNLDSVGSVSHRGSFFAKEIEVDDLDVPLIQVPFGFWFDLVATVTLDKTSVCQGDSVRVQVQTQPPGATPAPTVAIDGKAGSERYVSFDGAPGKRKIVVTVGFPSGFSQVREFDVNVVECPGQKFPSIAFSANRFHENTIDVRVLNASELSTTGATYIWDFGDGTTATTDVPHAAHDYGSRLQRDAELSAFQVSVRVQPASGPEVQGRRTVSIPNFYAINKNRGKLQLPVQQTRELTNQGSALVGSYGVTNLENVSIALTSRFFEYQFCDTTLEPQRSAIQAENIALAPGEQQSRTVQFELASIPSGACRVGVYLMGQSASGVAASVSLYFEIQKPSMEGVTDPEWASVFRQVVEQGLVSNPDHFTDEDLLRLSYEGKVQLPETEPGSSSLETLAQGATIGEICDPQQAPPDGILDITCQAAFDLNGNPEMVVSRPYIENALRGDAVLSAGCGAIGTLLRAVHPPQLFSHTGIMVENNTVLRNSTAVEARLFQTFRDAIDQLDPDAFRPEVLRFGWPGAITQTIPQAYDQGLLQLDPDGVSRSIRPFSATEAFCPGDDVPTGPRVLKAPLGSGEAGRAPLRAAAQASLGISSHYSFFAYTRSDDMAVASAPASAGWAQGLPGNQCASFIWMAFTAGTNVELEGAFENEELARSGLFDTGIDGLYGYTAAQRLGAATVLYKTIYDKVAAESTFIGDAAQTVFGFDVPDIIANIIVNCFAFDDCSNPGSGWRDGVGEGFAVSPDNLMMYDVYGHNERLSYRQREVVRVNRWAASPGSGTVTGRVVDRNGTPVADVDVVLGGELDAVSGPDGSFRFDAVRSGTYVLTAVKTIDGIVNRGHRDVVVPVGGTTDVTIFIEPEDTRRMFNVVGVLSELRDIDGVGEDDDVFNDGNPFPFECHLPVNPGTPDVCCPEFNPCIDEIRLRVQFCAHLDPTDLKTLNVEVRQSLFESDDLTVGGCDVTGAGLSNPATAALAPGTNTSFNDGGLEIEDDAVARWSAVVSNSLEGGP